MRPLIVLVVGVVVEAFRLLAYSVTISMEGHHYGVRFVHHNLPHPFCTLPLRS